MTDDASHSALTTAFQWLAGSGILAGLGVLARGYFSGTSGQEKEVRESLAERNKALESQRVLLEKRLEAVTAHRDAWRHAAFQGRLEAERLGYDRSKWPPDPVEPPTGGTP